MTLFSTKTAERRLALNIRIGLASVRLLAGLTSMATLYADDVGDPSCIQDMLLSSYGSIARKAAQPGTVTAIVTVAPTGSLADLTLKATDKFLALEVETFLRGNTTFRSDCAGKKITIMFTFLLKGPPQINPSVNIRFRGPNHFVIESQPGAPYAVPRQQEK
jgi:hypothetical protein